MMVRSVDGVGLWWERQGAGPPDVVLVPGRGDSSDLFPQLFIERQLADGASVTRFDPRDTGLSEDGGDSYTLSTMADDIVTVLDASDIERAHLVAVSMGGMIVVDLESRYPDRVASTTFISAMSPDPRAEMGPDFFEPLVETNRADAQLGLMGGLTDYDRAFVESEVTRADQRAPHRPDATERHMAAALRFGWPDLKCLADMSAPARVIHGTDDRILPVAHATALARGIPDSDMRIMAGMGHLPTKTQWANIGDMTSEHIMGVFDSVAG